METCAVYAVIHRASLRAYVGQAWRVERRWREHRRLAERGREHTRFYQALKAHGPEAFDWIILERCPRENLAKREMWWIADLRTRVPLYNHTPGGEGMRAGSRHSEDACAAKSLRQRGRPHSAEHNAAVARSLKGRVPRRMIEAAAAANRGRPRPRTPEHQKKIDDARRGKKMPPGALQKSWETRRANAANDKSFQKGHRLSDAHVAALIEAHRRRRARERGDE